MENKVLAVISGSEITEKDLNAIIMRYPEEQRQCLALKWGKSNY